MDMMQFFQAFWGKLQDYLETRLSLLKIEIQEGIAKAASNLLFAFVGILAAFMALAMFSIALAQFIGWLFGISWVGSLVVSLIWLIVAAVAFSDKTRAKWQPRLEKQILDAILEKEKEVENTTETTENSPPTETL